MKFTERYPLAPFQVDDTEQLATVISDYPLATVISQREKIPLVTQVPLLFDVETKTLRGHMDRNNPHCDALAGGGAIYCVFNGPNHYISPAIYPDTQYPGWNYVAVHVEGMVETKTDSAWLTNLLLQTATENEPADSGYELRPDQARFDELLQYVVGFEVRISDMRGIFKLAQDKGPAHAELARKHLASLLRKDISSQLTDYLGPPG